MIQWLLWLGLLLSPFYNVLLFRLGGVELSAVDLPLLVALGLWSAWVIGRGRCRLTWPTVLLILFLVTSLASTVLSAEVLLGLRRWGRTAIRVLVFAVMLPDVMVRTTRWRVYVILFIVTGAVFGVLNYIDLFASPRTFMSGFFADPGRWSAHLRFIYPDPDYAGVNFGHEIGHWEAGALLMLLSIGLASVSARRRFGWGLLAVPIVTTLLFSLTKSAWLGLAVGLGYLMGRLYLSRAVAFRRGLVGVRFYPIWVTICVSAAVLVTGLLFWFVVLNSATRNLIILAFTFQDVSSSARLALWRGLVPIIRDHMLLGVGWGNLVGAGLSGDPHSWWLGILAETGGIGFLLYLAASVTMFFMIGRNSRRMTREGKFLAIGANAAMVSAGVAGLFEMSFMWSMNAWWLIGLAMFFTHRVCQAEPPSTAGACDSPECGVCGDE
jgi:O-Antigen ligase